MVRLIIVEAVFRLVLANVLLSMVYGHFITLGGYKLYNKGEQLFRRIESMKNDHFGWVVFLTLISYLLFDSLHFCNLYGLTRFMK